MCDCSGGFDVEFSAGSGGIPGTIIYRGIIDCSTNPNYPSGVSGDLYIVSVAGKIGGASGAVVSVGDQIICKNDNPGGTQAAVGSDWNVVEGNLGYTPENIANKDASNGYVGLTLFKINFLNTLGSFVSYFTNSNTASRTYSFQDRDGTIADNTDLALKQDLTGKDASNGYAGLTLLKINFKNVANTFTSFFTNTNTAARTYTFQDRDGTIADNTDLAGVLTTQTLGDLVNSATSKATPVDADQIPLMDSAAGNITKKLSWANVKATLKTYFDTLYSAIGATFFIGTTSIANNRASGSQTLTGVSIDGNAATVTTNANLTGNVTSVGNATTIAAGVVTEAMQVLADNTTQNVSTTKHGYAPKGDGDTTKFLNANGAYSVPATSAVIAASYYSDTTQAALTTQVDFNQSIYDTNSAVTTGASWKFTAPSSRKYRVTISISAGGVQYLDIRKNGTVYQRLVYTVVSAMNNASVELDLAATDYIDIYPLGAVTVNGSASADANRSCIQISSI